MKKSVGITIAIILCIVVLAAGLFSSKRRIEEFRWKVNYLLYGTTEPKKQEFEYHSQVSSHKSIVPSSPAAPNIVLISLDTLRAQSMSCYGFAKETTPFMDRIAHEGVLLENMCAAATSTPPSHMSMMTGYYLSVHGVLNAQVLDPHIKTLAEILSREDYATCAVTEDGYLVRDMGFGRGFDDYFEIKDVFLFDKLQIAGGFGKDVFEKGKNWIKDKQDRKFFLFLHTYEIHDPYFSPAPYNTMFVSPSVDYKKYLKKITKHFGRVMNYRDFPPEFVRAQYEGEIRYVDEMMKDFISFLEEERLGRKTLVIITSDHGEELFEHQDIQGHGYHTYDVESHIPFIMWMPGRIPAGVRIRSQASNVDILPTLLDFLKVDLEGQVQGRSFYPLIQNPTQVKDRHVFCEAVNQTSVRSSEYKFIDNNELYLYDEDPEEKLNRAGERAQLCVDGANAINEFRGECRSLKIAKGLLAPSKEVHLSEEDIKKLRALGYVQ